MGGTASASVNTCLAAAAAGIDATFVFARDAQSLLATRATIDTLRNAGVAVAHFPLWRRLPGVSKHWGLSGPLVAWLWRHARDYDVIHAHGAWQITTLMAMLAGRRGGCRLVLTPHETFTRYDMEVAGSPVTRLLKRHLKPIYEAGFDAFVVSSGLELDDSGGSRDDPRWRVIPHAVDDQTLSHAPRRWEPGTTPLRLGFLGRLHPKKNIDVLIDALAGLPGHIDLKIAGQGEAEFEADLRRRAERRGVAGRIAWLGFIAADDHAAFFDAIDMLVMPSAYECFGMVAAEAMIHGVPVVVSPTTGVAEVIGRRECGLVVAAEAQAVAGAVTSLDSDRPRLTAMSARAIETAAEMFSYAAHGGETRRLYESLGAVRRPTPGVLRPDTP